MLPLTDGERSFLLESTEREVVCKLEVVERSSGNVVKTIETWMDDVPEDLRDADRLMIVGGNVREDTSSEVLRTLSLELVDPLHEVTVGVDGLIGLDKFLRVFKGYKIPSPWGSGGYTLWPLGVFVLNGRPVIDGTSGQRIIRIQGGDKSCTGNGRPEGGFQTAYRVAQGTTKRAAIQALGQYYGETLFNLTPDSGATVPYDYPFESRDNPWAAIQRINQITETGSKITRCYYDPYGRLTLAFDPGPDLDTLPAVWTAQPVTSGFSQLVGAQMEPDLLSLGNASRVYYGSSRGAPGVVMVADTSATSPTSVNRIGYRIKDWKNGQQDDLIWTQAEATARATFELRQMLSYQEQVPLALLENPALEPWDALSVAESQADVNGKYQLLSFTVDLGTSGTMQAQGWRIRKLA